MEAPKYIRNILEDHKKDIDSSAPIVGDFDTPVSTVDIFQTKNRQEHCGTLDQVDLTVIYRIFNLKEAKYTFFSNAHGICSNTDHMVGHKTSFKEFKKIKIISSIFSDHNGLKLETNMKEKIQKQANSCSLNNMLLNNEWVKNEIKLEIKKFLETNENEHTISKTYETQ